VNTLHIAVSIAFNLMWHGKRYLDILPVGLFLGFLFLVLLGLVFSIIGPGPSVEAMMVEMIKGLTEQIGLLVVGQLGAD